MNKKIHYKSEWHTYNLKRKVAGVPGLTEALYKARQSALLETPLLYSCEHCGKEFTTSKAHAQHLKSKKTHLARASQEIAHHHEWEEVDQEEEIACEDNDSLKELKMNRSSTSSGVKDEEFDPRCCFMCDMKHDTVENCTIHMHKKHGFFIPDIEYLKDPKGFITYLGLKVRRDYMCLYCNDRCRPFSSLEAVRKHMDAKNHCKVHYGDGGDDEEAELEEFYDYSSSYVDTTGKQLVSSGDFNNNVELGSGGSELIITTRTDDRLSVKSIGSREFLRYYRQKPKPTRTNDTAISSA